MTERAHARVSDPSTSHQAADAVTPGLPELQRIVENYALRCPNGFFDVGLCEAFPDLGGSTLRTRRSELAARNIILAHGKGKPPGATTPHTIWIHRNFATGFVPDVLDPPTAALPAICEEARADGLAMAAKLDEYSAQMRREGRTYLATELADAARIMRSLTR